VGVNVNYLSAVIGEDAFAEGRVLKRGKEIIYCDVRVSNAAGKLLAQGTVVYRIERRAGSRNYTLLSGKTYSVQALRQTAIWCRI
jgi:hypothetical protein